MTSLQVMTISQSSAVQRKGRAGRTSSGTCIRLYSEKDFDTMQAGVVPELLRVPLANTVVNLIKMNIDVSAFNWLDAPDANAIANALDELDYMECVQKVNGRLSLTDLGNFIAETQLAPGSAKMIFESCRRGMAEAAIRLAAIVQVSDVFFWRVAASDTERKAKAHEAMVSFASHNGDLITMFNLYTKYEEMIRKQTVTTDVKNSIQSNFDSTQLSSNDLLDQLPNIDLNKLEENEDIDNKSDTISEVSSSLVASVSISSQNGNENESVVSNDVAVMEDLDEYEKAELNDYENERNEEKRAQNFLKENKKIINDWLRQNFISQKALSLITTNYRALLKTTRSMKNVWNLDSVQNKTPSESDLAQLLFQGMFLNFAVKTKLNQYQAVRSKLVGRLHPASVLVKLDEYPDYICYMSIFRTHSVFFQMPVVCKRDWLRNVSSRFESTIKELQKLPFENIPFSLLKIFVGKNGEKMRDFESQYECTCEVDYNNESITAWVGADQVEKIKKEINKRIETARNEARLEVDEIKLNNSTSLLVGAGGELLNILCSGDYCSVVFRGLSSRDTVAKLRTRIERELGYLRSLNLMEDQSMSKYVAYAMFTDSTVAKKACQIFNNEIIDACRVTCVPGGTPNPTSFKDITGQLKLFIDFGVSTGEATVVFPNTEIANKAIDILNHNALLLSTGNLRINPIGNLKDQPSYQKPNIKIKQFDSKLPFITPDKKHFLLETTPNDKLLVQISIKNLNKNETEITLKKMLDDAKITTGKITVKREADQNLNSSTHLMEYIADWNKIIPFSQEFKPTLVEYRDDKKCQTGFFVTYDTPEQTKIAFDSCKDQVSEINGQKVQIHILFQGSYSIHSQLYKSQQAEIDSLIEAESNELTIKKIFNKDAKNQSKTLFILKAKNLEKIQKFQQKLESALKYDYYRNMNQNILFSRVGRNKMQTISTAYLHWENKSRQVRIYGNDKTRLEAKLQIDKIIDELKDLSLDVEFVLKKNCFDTFKKNEPNLKSINGVYHLNSTKKTLTVTATKNAIDEFAKKLNELNLIGKKPSQKKQSNGRDCFICFCEIENKVTLLNCSHSACEDCLSEMIESAKNQLPITCKSENCNKVLFLSDLKKLVKTETLEEICEKAKIDFVNNHSDNFVECPKIECGQIIKKPRMCQNDDEERRAGGKLVISCDICLGSYCLTCTREKDKLCFSHKDELCIEVESEFHTIVKKHRNAIFELINQKCPNCKTCFYDFDGCCAVSCENCKKSFCGICLEYFSDNAHDHVRSCEFNPRKGGYFLRREEILQVWKQRNKELFSKYLNEKFSNGQKDLRQAVYDACKNIID